MFLTGQNESMSIFAVLLLSVYPDHLSAIIFVNFESGLPVSQLFAWRHLLPVAAFRTDFLLNIYRAILMLRCGVETHANIVSDIYGVISVK